MFHVVTGDITALKWTFLYLYIHIQNHFFYIINKGESNSVQSENRGHYCDRHTSDIGVAIDILNFCSFRRIFILMRLMIETQGFYFSF